MLFVCKYSRMCSYYETGQNIVEYTDLNNNVERKKKLVGGDYSHGYLCWSCTKYDLPLWGLY